MSNTPVTVIPKTPAEVAKAIIYIALSALGILQAALATHHFGLVDGLNIAVVVFGAIPVYLFSGTLVKTIIGFSLAALEALIHILGSVVGLGAVSAADWIGIAFAAFAAVGIAIIPNRAPNASATYVSNFTTTSGSGGVTVPPQLSK